MQRDILLNALITIRGPRLLSGTSSSPTSTSPRRHLNKSQGNSNQINSDPLNTYNLRASPRSIHSNIITGTQGNGDRPAEVPVCPAWLPEDPATGKHRSKQQKKEKKIRGCQRNRSTRPANQLEVHLNRASIPAQCINRGNHRSVIIRPVSHHSSVVFRHNQSIGHHSNDSVGPFKHDTSVCRSQRGSISGHQSINMAQYHHIKQISMTRNIGMIMLIDVYSSSTRTFNSQVLLNRSHQARQLQLTQLLFTGHGTTTKQGLPYSSNLGIERAKELSGSACENSRATLLLRDPSHTSTQDSQLVLIDRATQYELNATCLAPKNGGIRRQLIGEGFE
ncbi:strictosidine synthase 3-like [Dorcoceras hygrometricum]|uniref:Strictosidine synthase 3-like n=1 Tax=Dorcoceras hygrometricum TaxID=472368 RepID=A0A2Z7ANA9_9LAMI|nr:strictosidine synthase 3-like [Dorcoceras hygrometricum]